MKIKYLKKDKLSEIININFDLVIACSGFEKRASYLFENNHIISSNKLCFGFLNNKSLSREYNDNLFSSKNFRFVNIDNNSYDQILIVFEKELLSLGRTNVSILVDISSMSTLMYASILRVLNDNSFFHEVDIYFSYTQATYSSPDKERSLKFNNPINILNNIESTDKKIALIIGLGYDKDKALGLYEYFQNDLKDMFLFITSNNDFSSDVNSNNKELISILDGNNIIYYDLDNVTYLTNSLNSLISYLTNKNYRVVIVPTGPKVFSLIALVTSIYNKNVSVYRSSTGILDEAKDKFADPNKDFIVTRVNFINS